MPTPILKRKLPAIRRRHNPTDPFYGHGYRPDWPSILSIAHDTTDGSRLLVVMDRPCVALGSVADFPLTVPGVSIVGGTSVLPVKFRLQMSGAVPQGSAWTWGPAGGGGDDLVDPITNNPLNPASGTCADVPGPFTPTAVSILSVTAAGGSTVIIVFSGPVGVDAGVGPDGALAIGGGANVPSAISAIDSTHVSVEFAFSVSGGEAWNLSAQPNWLLTPVDPLPEGGTVAT